jgi:D-threo-aldose 1-dehydrogenase
MTLSLPRLGMGTAGIGNLYAPVSDGEASATAAAAFAAGIRYFDTAPHYGFGLAERRLGEALANVDPGGEAIVSTKVGRVLEPVSSAARERHGFVEADPFEPRFDYRRDAILSSHEESLKRLRRDRVDILLAHDLGTLTHGGEAERHMDDFLGSGHAAMRELKQAGAVDLIGVGVNEIDVCEYLIERVEIDLILIAGRYTLLDQSAGERLLPLCLARGIRVVIGGPYNSGILAQPVAAQNDLRYDYRAPPEPMLERAASLEQACAAQGVPLAAAALQFSLRHPAVSSVIPGPVGPAQLEETIERMNMPIPESLWTTLDEAGLVRDPRVGA